VRPVSPLEDPLLNPPDVTPPDDSLEEPDDPLEEPDELPEDVESFVPRVDAPP